MPEPKPRGIGPRPGRDPAAVAPRRAGLREIAVELIRPNDRPAAQGVRRRGADRAGRVDQGPRGPPAARGAAAAGGEYELIAGERRLRAAKLAGLEQVPALVRDTDESDRLELALIENMAREDLNPVEEARACATLVEDLGITKEELGRRLGRSRAWRSRT